MSTDASWHSKAPQAVLTDLNTRPTGLTDREAQERLDAHGPNRLPQPQKRSAFMRFLLQFHNILIYVLLGSAVITAAMSHWVDTFVILAVVIANAVIGFVQEGKAEKAMDAIRHMLAPHASVIRDGERRSVDGETLVPGDIVLLEAGDKVPADLRLLQAHALQVQEAILTGESVPVEKQIDAVTGNAALGDRTCLAFSGTLVTSGQAIGVVIATGAVDDSVGFSLGATYLFTKHWALEVFGTLPIDHELTIDRDRVGTFEVVPATATVQYHIADAQQRIRAYAGLGVTYADLGAERSDGTFANRKLELSDSVGAAAVAGLDMNMGRRWFVNIDARWFDIDADVKLDAANLGRLRVDPYAFGVSIGRRLR